MTINAEMLNVARETIAKAVAACGRADIEFNALAGANPVTVVQMRREQALARPTAANRAMVAACDEWLAANA